MAYDTPTLSPELPLEAASAAPLKRPALRTLALIVSLAAAFGVLPFVGSD